MLQQRFEYNARKKYVYLRVPLYATLHCKVEISNDEKNVVYTSPEFPCRSIKSKNITTISLVGVENSGCLKSENLGTNSFRLKYRIDDKGCDMEEFVFLPLNNTVVFSFTYGTEDDFAVSVGSQSVMVYTFIQEHKEIETTWMTSPWRLTMSMETIKKGVSIFLDDAKKYLELEPSVT